MKINDIPEQGRPARVPLQLIRIMKLTAIIITFCLIQVSAATKAQITLNEKKAPLQKVLESISTQSGYDFIYSTQDLKDLKTGVIKLKNVDIETALKAAFESQPLQYEIADKTVMVKRKEEKSVIEKVKDFLGLIDVHGRVVDEKGQPLLGVTIKLRDGSQITTTDKDGFFFLRKVDEHAVVIISSIGLLTKEVNAKADLGTIQLEMSNSKLDEVQVQAYGITSRRLSTGNIGTVKAADIEKQPVNNPLLALQGRVPGVFIEQSTGISGAGISVRIQGINSIGKGNDPLYVIDGVPYSSQLLSTNLNDILGTSGTGVGSFGASNGNPLAFINPTDIESIDILKDADATSIYGSRAGNGAILITTKKGKPGQTKVDVTLQSGQGRVTRTRHLLNTQQFLEMRREAFANGGGTPDPIYDPDVNGHWDLNRYTDWQKEFIGGKSIYTDVQTSVSGGNTNTQFLIGGGYHHETTVFPGSFGDKKGSIHFNINNVSSNQRFRLQFSGSYLSDGNKLPGSDLTNVVDSPPNAPQLYNSDGSLNWSPLPDGTTTFYNPLAPLLYQTQTIETNNLISNATLSYQILPGLNIKSNFGYNRMQSNGTSAFQLLSIAPENRPFSQRTAAYSINTTSSWIVEPQISYTNQIGKGKLDVLIGTTIQQNDSDGLLLRARGFISDLVLDDIKSASSVSVSSSIRSIYKYNALFGRINYNIDDKYILNLTARRDGSSRFGSQNLFHNFASLGAAWIFSNESLIKDNIPFLSFGKLKGSYGTTGNDQIGDYSFLNLYQNSDNYGVAYQGKTGLEPVGLPNPYLQWEETRKLQLGLDLGFLNDRILLNVGYFRNRSSNQILNYSLSIVTGVDGIASNFPATVQNSGLELSLNTLNVKAKNFNWSTNLNITLPRNKLLAFPNLEKSSYFGSALVIGQPLTLVKTYHFLGVNPNTGFYQVADKNGTPTSDPNPLTDKTVFINTASTLYGGFQNSFSYKEFSLDILFQFVKQKAQNSYFGNLPGMSYQNQPVNVLSRWQKVGDIAQIQKFTTDFAAFTPFSAATNSDKAYSDASYIRLKNLSFSWQIPDTWKKKANLQNCRLFVQGQNLLTITKYPGLDPENRTLTSLPPLQVITVGLNITL